MLGGYSCSAGALSAYVAKPTDRQVAVYLAIGDGQIRWVKLACPISAIAYKNCELTISQGVSGQVANECLQYTGLSTEIGSWGFANLIRPESDFLAWGDRAVIDTFELARGHTASYARPPKLRITRPADTVDSKSGLFPANLEFFNSGNDDFSVSYRQRIVRATDQDLRRFATNADRDCMGQNASALLN